MSRGIDRKICNVLSEASRFAGEWRDRQSGVKEESITDWLLDDVSRRCPLVHYQAYNRHEEGQQTGADWEWWFLYAGCVYHRFRVQAKKAKPGENHFQSITQANRTHVQIELFIQTCLDQGVNAQPLYAFYAPSVSVQVCHRLPTEGVLIVPGQVVWSEFYQGSGGWVTYSDILQKAVALSCLACCLIPPPPLPPSVIWHGEAQGKVFPGEGGVGIHTTLPDYVTRLVEGEAQDVTEDDGAAELDFRHLLVFDLR